MVSKNSLVEYISQTALNPVVPILPLVTFGNAFFFHFLTYPKVIVDLGEHYQKQTWRNRYDIVGANGPLSLTVPVVGQKGLKTPLREIEIDNTQGWAGLHWKTLISAYRSSPFFDHYSEQIEPIFQKKWHLLADLNMATCKLALEWLDLTPQIERSEQFVEGRSTALDLRPAFKPSRFDSIDFQPSEYIQVFADRFDFFPNRSILDVVFNLGPEAGSYISKIPFDESQIAILGR